MFSGALSLLYAQVDAEFDGGLDALCCDFFDLKALDSLEFERQYALAPSKQEKARNEVFSSPDGRYGLRPLTAKDKMAGLEFILSQGPNTSQKVTVEDLAGGKALQMARQLPDAFWSNGGTIWAA